MCQDKKYAYVHAVLRMEMLPLTKHILNSFFINEIRY